MAFDDRDVKKDPNHIFRTERNIKATMFLWILILSVIISYLLLVSLFYCL